MSITQDYKKIYKNKIQEGFNKEIKVYKSVIDVNEYTSFSHNCQMSCNNNCKHNCYMKLGKLMRDNLIFYCYGEEEIVRKTTAHFFDDFTNSVRYAYINRVPKRNAKQDGLLSEVLFDLIIQNLFPDARKLAVRTIFRQNNNKEIKGYDLTYFINNNGKIQVWLGQAKLGSKKYCKEGIDDDLVKKYEMLYMSKQVFFISDKQCGLSDEGIALTDVINKINMLNSQNDDTKRADAFLKFIADEDIEIVIPCLLSYGENSVYKDIADVERKIEKEITSIKKYFENKNYEFKGFIPKLLFFVFPLESIKGLRSEEGFYEGLR